MTGMAQGADLLVAELALQAGLHDRCDPADATR